MKYIGFISTLFAILGISFLSIFLGIIALLKEYKQYNFTRETRRNCIKRYIELPYFIENQRNEKHKYKLTKKLYYIIFKSRIDKIVFIIGKSGAGRTCLVNRFIMKYYLYAQIKGKKIVRVSGLECNNLLQQIERIENKNDTILIIDGLEEAFIYQKNRIDILNVFNKNLLIFSKCILTVNIDFYEENNFTLNDFYYRNAEQKKVYATKIYLKPFDDRLIIKYINKNIKVSRYEKKSIINRAFQNKDFFSYPLMLSFILFFEEYKGEYISQLEILKHIFEQSLNWEGNKYTKSKQASIGLQNTNKIMNKISKNFLYGRMPIIKSQEKIRNVLLDYDKKTKEYRFQNQIFLIYNTIRKYYSKIGENSKLKSYVVIYPDFRNIYFDLILQRHKCFIETNLIVLQFKHEPYLTIKTSAIFNEKWIMGLAKCLFGYKIKVNSTLLMAYRVNEISKLYYYEKYLDLHDINLDLQQIEWWANLNIEALNISNTNLDKINLPYNWYKVKKIIAQNLSIKSIYSLNKFSLLEELDLSGSKIIKIEDLNSLKTLPNRINLDLSNCEITNEIIPTLIFNTVFNGIYLDYNKLTDATFINNMKFDHLNLSNNPIVLDREKIINNKIVCNYYFNDDNITNFLCGNKLFLTYDEAIKLKEIDISNIEVKNMCGVECLPNLKILTINLFQVQLLIENMFTNSPLEVIKIKTFYLNQLHYFKYFYNSLITLLMNDETIYDDFDLHLSIILDNVHDLFGSDYSLKIIGIEEMTNFLNIDIGYFYRRVVDVYNYIKNFVFKHKNEIGIKQSLQFNINIDYEQKLNEIYNNFDIKPFPPCTDIDQLLPFFSVISKFFDNYAIHASEDMEAVLKKRIGKSVKVFYLYPDGKLI